MADSVSTEAWLDQRRWAALEEALKAQGSNVKRHLQDYLITLYNETVPLERWVQIETAITKEELESAQAAEDQKVYAAFHIRENGHDSIFSTGNGEEFLDVAIRLRRYLQGDAEAVKGGFSHHFYKTQPITRERFDELAALRLENTGKVSGAFEIDLDAGWCSALNLADGWQTFKNKDVSTAAYHANRTRNLQRNEQWRRLVDYAAERGGHAISFVQNFYGLTYPEAVTRLLNGEQGEVYIPAEKKEKEPPKEFALPPSNQAMRRVYAYLLQQRHISREVLSAFAQKGLIYESRELSIDQTKVYHNAVFVGFDERGVARHAHKRGLYTQGKSYRGNIEGSDPRCSFHWVGTSDRLYVFEAPIDLLAFLTLYPDGWQQHSYVALCGTAEHAMLWMLEKNPNLRKTILCLDHDAAGIEAVGRLSDVLREHGYSQIAPLQSEYKDWDEDLKARHGLEAQPAEEHPQFVAADLVCQRIGTRCKEVQPDRAAYQIPGLLLQYRNDLHWGRFDQAMEHMETMAALSLSVVLRECKQMGTALTVEQGVRFLESHILPHQNRSILKNRADEIAMQFQSVLAKNNRQGIRTQAEKKEVASAWLELAISCAKVPVKYEADEIKRRQKEEKTQRETEPVMA